MLALMPLGDIVSTLGRRIKEERLRQGKYTQKEFSKKAGIPLSTYKRIEQTGKGSIEDFVRCLMVLRKLNDLDVLLSKPEYSPIQAAKFKNKPVKKRIYKKREKRA